LSSQSSQNIPDRLTPARRILLLLGGTLATLLLQTGAVFLGPAGFLLNLLVPLPAAYVHMRAGSLAGGGTVVATTAILLSSGVPPAMLYLLQFGLGSFVLPLLLRRGWGWDRAVAGTVIAVVATVALTLAGLALTRDLGVGELVRGYIHQEVDRALAVYRDADLSKEQLARLQDLLQSAAHFMSRAWVGLTALVMGVAGLVVTGGLALAGRGRFRIPGPSFAAWKSPEPLVWVLILGGFGAIFAEGLAQTAALNLLAFLLPVYFLQGLAIVAYFFSKRQVSPVFRVLGYLLIVVLNPLPLLVTGIGVFDLWADFRRPRVKKT
jgi:uncharacterized protein YybS (DUF2232 family)